MNKDALLATFIGFIVGLVVTGFVLYGPAIMKNMPKLQLPKIAFSLPNFSKPKTTPTPTPTGIKKEHAVLIESPLPDALEQTDKMLVSGTTSANATVIISGLVDEVVVTANNDGKYAGKVTLVEGKNDISVTSIEQANQAVQTVTVFYTPEEW
jgi:hypothetical protein